MDQWKDEGAVRDAPLISFEPALRIPKRGVYNEEARLQRLEFVREQSGRTLPSLQRTTLAAERLTGNVENLIGSVEVPVGLAGPLRFTGESVKGIIYAPLATTEGALVASASRGAIAVSRSGGVATHLVRQQMTRVPLFVFEDMQGAVRFARWVTAHADEIRERTRRVSAHARLTALEPLVMGRLVHLSFRYETGDAAGQNMTTSCTWHACQWIMEEIRGMDDLTLETFIIEGGMSGDKKVTFQNLIAGRGARVTAECFISASVLSRVLHVTPEQVLKAHERGLSASVQAGMVGYNVNTANIVAALFTATGQDIACVHESSLAQFHLERTDGGICASLLLPSLIVGSVGGGTHLPSQNDCLQIMDCAGAGKGGRLAEIIAGYCLATDLSTISAIAGGQFAAAHERLGRNRAVRWFTREDLTPAFFEPGLRRATGDDTLVVKSATPSAAPFEGNSILTELTGRRIRKLVGLFPYELNCESRPGGAIAPIEVMVKVKPVDEEVMLAAGSLAAMSGERLQATYARFKDRTSFSGCHVRELMVCKQTDSRFTRHVPTIYETFRDDSREAYVMVMERLVDVTHLDSADDPSGWSPCHVEAALRGIAQIHAIWYRREDEILRLPWLGPVPSAQSMTEMAELWHHLGVHAFQEFPEWISSETLAAHHDLVNRIPEWWSQIETMPRTLIHNDFNPRNIALRKDGPEPRLCAYDWELATLHLPQHDLAELLCFVLNPEATAEEVSHYLEVHRRALEESSGYAVDRRTWRSGFELSLADFAVNRMGLYLMAHTLQHYGFMERVVRTLQRLMTLGSGR